ncbi:MAG: DUF1573 domain-containing protein [Cellulophaga sp.]|uniref:DUF1573 domain-containing protein n=2 Tax=Cellulophaga TaxID=104264 RepID=UPI000C2C7A2C|nr:MULTISPECIES: DUF1573 domain-containing protein [unclassified Cellulophaga]MDO6492151.1 DUF1573 domain-containing protein [Cellulophaga sp. 2_MG-2023]MDO6495688.1 DUF1573 domain-containing protein [Cellulophaga sp. 3_MG-2023]PKB43858.1 uncharacterized protein DUF1573 [Cellulophaga sp. RHA19]|eukprot:TRINITY_DN5350_c3_g2_i1.p1 TRINITY_DN5350_c3_g2~~TRINITY_DN5350_c3_g2_i1.p1  ORF type:complete len:160 (-),score=45.33 TRINITY_DN5350_c3_g2_i1:299-778(-)
MKKIILLFGVAVFAMSFTACKDNASNKIIMANVDNAAERDSNAKNLPEMSFDRTEFDFGTITQGTPQQTVFTFTNTGTAPLIITDAKSTCGCTIPEYPKNKAIAPGESGELLVKFNGSGQNQVTKAVTVTANTAKGRETLRIKAFVNPKNGAAASIPTK